ncbi:hypothetical protein ECZU29_32250 [Escherichia coli]|nr:hypothetical protein ECZU29_32250 [Escherichia coli]
MPRMSDSSTSPHSEFASGVRAWAIRLPSAVSCTRGISSETKAINGITLRSDVHRLTAGGEQQGDNVADGGAGLLDHAHQFLRTARGGGRW